MAAIEEDNIIDEPIYPKYKIGGCIAKMGSCRIGFNPSPSFGEGNKWLNGLEVRIRKKKNPIIMICWNNNVNIWYFFGSFFEVLINHWIFYLPDQH